MTMQMFVLSLLVLAAGGLFCSFWSGERVSRLGATINIVGVILSILPAAKVLWTGESVGISLPWSIPFGAFHIAVDPLSALFIIVIGVVSLFAAVYGIGYLKSFEGYNKGASWFFFNLLTVCMLLIVMSRNGILFIMAWEGMSLTSFFLVMFEHGKPEVRKAGWIYLAAAHLGAACLLALFLLMGGTEGNLDFDALIAPSGQFAVGLLFVLAVLGFGAKAGFMPLHVWLPEAHPAAPSHVSAVMSGVMIKTGIYGLVRIISLLGPPQAWWGWTLLSIGAVSGIMGVLYALAQHDLKRLLAYSSVENIGIICMGLGLWLLGGATGHTEVAVLGLVGGLLHVCNHAIFKSLLFLGAGAVKHATHTLEIDRLGGLQKRMPKTAVTFLIGSAAISGIPPFNGFVGELFIYLAALGAVINTASNGGLTAGGMVVLLSLSMIGGLAAACFTKVYGIVFLGEPRTTDVLHAVESPKSMWMPMAALAGLCALLGFGAPLGVLVVMPAVGQLLGNTVAETALMAVVPVLIYIAAAGGAIVAISLLFAGVRRRLLKGRTVDTGGTWDCGYSAPSARMQYTGSSFAWPVMDMFRWIIRPRLNVRMEEGDFPQQAQLESHTRDLFMRYLFSPLFRLADFISRNLQVLQQGHNQLYILYIAITILILLLLKLR